MPEAIPNNKITIPMLVRRDPLYIKRDNNTFHKVDLSKLKEEVSFVDDEIIQQIVYDGNVIINGSDAFSAQIKEKFFVKDGNVMTQVPIMSRSIHIRQKILHDPKGYASRCMVYRNTNTGKLYGQTYCSVEGGVISLNDDVVQNLWYTFNAESEEFVTDVVRNVYASTYEGKFYGCAAVVDEDNRPWSDYICLSNDEKAIITEAVKKFRDTLNSLKVEMVFDNSDGALRFIKNESNLPNGCQYNETDRSEEETNGYFQIPDSAYFDTEERFKAKEITDNYGTYVVVGSPKQPEETVNS
jgi:hypothetical protein